MLPSKKIRAAVVVAGVALGALSAGGVAQAACPPVPTSQPFAQFGDTANYTLAPGGGFEAGMAPWTLSGAAVVSGNETYFVRSQSDVSSLRIAERGVATSPELCVDRDYPTLRFFARNPGGTAAELSVRITYQNADGRTVEVPAGTVRHDGTSYAAWTPSPALKLATGLPVGSGELMVRLKFTADDRGAWAIDDVYADPYRVG